MGKCLLYFFLFYSPVTCFSQSLLPNGGFEDENTCTEFVINCVPEAWISNQRGLSNYITDSSRSYKGKHCFAIEAGHATRPYERTFIRSQLLCKLQKGKHYRVELYIKSPHSFMDSVGISFDTIEPLLQKKEVRAIVPAVVIASNPANKFKSDSSWQKAVMEYTATGEERFMIIANFSRNDITGSTGISRRHNFYFFVDEISMIPVDPKERLCYNWKEVKKDIYNMNERHQFMERVLKMRESNPQKRVEPGRMQ